MVTILMVSTQRVHKNGLQIKFGKYTNYPYQEEPDRPVTYVAQSKIPVS